MNTEIDISYMTLQTKRLTLRPWKQTDLDDFYAYASVDGVGQMAGWKPHDNKEESQTILNMFLEEKKTWNIREKLYGVVRHPMYMATLLLLLMMPLVLGSLISFVSMLAYLPIIGKRIRNEERVLEEGLEGYREYKERVKYKVIPFIW